MTFTDNLVQYFTEEQDSIEAGEWDHTDRELQNANYVTVIFPSGISSQFQAAFTQAAAFWNNALGASPVTPLTFTSSFNVGTSLPGCGVSFTFGAGSTIKGLAIFAEVTPIDGVGAILGQAGPCGFTSANGFSYPRLGHMQFDSADMTALLNAGSLNQVITHEMGHVLGIGPSWGNLVTGRGGSNPTYAGANGKAGFRSLGGANVNIPVENTGGAGTRDAHWRESTFNNELMTGFLNNGNNPLSIMSVASLVDIGYNVNLNAAQAYSLPRPEDEVVAGEIAMVGDILEIEPLDLDAAIESNEAAKADQAKFVEFGVFVAVVATLIALMAAVVVFVAYKMKKNEKSVAAAPVEASVAHFAVPENKDEVSM